MQRRDLEGRTREDLIAEAERLSVPRPRVLTQPELIDEILARSARDERERTRVRGFLGRARDLLARVVERGLHLPEAARALRGTPPPEPWPPPPPPLPTVTLAEIYAAQGHIERALGVLDEVLSREPGHQGAQQLRARLLESSKRTRGKRVDEPMLLAQAKADAMVESKTALPLAQRAASPAVQPERAKAAPEDETAAVVQEESVSEEAQEQPAPAAGEQVRPEKVAEAPLARKTKQAPAAAKAELPSVPKGEGVALPERYDVDEIVGMAVDPETVYVYWEVRPVTLARARARRPLGQLSIRIVAVLPSWDGPKVEQRDILVDALFGDRFVRDIPAGANVRMSIGWIDGADFEPFAVGAEITAPRAILPPAAVHAAAPAWESPMAAPPSDAAAGSAPARAGLRRGALASGPARAAAAPAGRRARRTGPARGAFVQVEAEEEAEEVSWIEGPRRFPSGTTPTSYEIARAVAVTRGGASELGRGPIGARELGRVLGGASELGRVPGGASELGRLRDR